jgi:hypothetical protein
VLAVAAVACTIGLVAAMLLPPRVLLVGDSITGQYAPMAAAELRHRGYDPVVRAYPGVGLLDRGPWIDAPFRVRADLTTTAPSVVVAEFSGDCGVVDPQLPGVPPGSDAFITAWKTQADAFTRQARAQGANHVWLLAPRPVRGGSSVDQRLAAVYQEESRAGVSVLDPGPVFSRYEVNGNLHASDGRHLSAAGSTLVARLVVQRVAAEPPWQLRLRALSRSLLATATAAVALAALIAAIALRPRRRRALRLSRTSVPPPRWLRS